MAGEWVEKPLGELVQNFDARRIPLSSREREKRRGRFPYYGATGVVDYVDDFLYEGLYLLVAEDGSVERPDGKPFLQLASGQFWVNNHAHVLRGTTDEETKYLYYALSTVPIRPYISGSVQPKLSQANLNRIPVPYPEDEADRRAIAQILGTLDDKIELNRRMSETLEAMARALFKAWFVDFEPVRAKMEGRWQRGQSLPGLPAHLYDLLPDRLVESELGEIPEGWRCSTIGEEVTVCGGSTPSTKEPAFWEGGQHCWATPKDLSSLRFPVLLDTERKITNAGLARISSGLLPVGTVLLSSRAPIGYLAITEVPTAINQGFIAMKCDGVLPNVFVLLWCRENMDAIVGNANGSTFLEISKSNFRPLRVVVPSNEVLTNFSKLAAPLYRQLAENEHESRTLAKLRDTLLPKLISGELRLKDAAKLVEAEKI